jgi:hypothetical protein
MSNQSKHRTVNTTLGKQPNIGLFPSEQLIPWAIICGVSYYLAHGLFKLNWIWTCGIAAWGISTWWALTANGSWKILSKLIATPNWTRACITYQQILHSHQQLNTRNQNETKSRKTHRR